MGGAGDPPAPVGDPPNICLAAKARCHASQGQRPGNAQGNAPGKRRTIGFSAESPT